MTRTVLLSALLFLPALAAVDGVVTNATAGKPQPGVAVTLVQPTEQGMQPLGTAKSGPDGKFTIDKQVPPGGPVLLQALYQGVTYSKVLPPGTPTSNITVEVFDASARPERVAVNRHGILFEPAQDRLVVREFVFIDNASRTTYNDSTNGTYRMFVPDGAAGIKVQITAPGSMPVARPATKTAQANIYKLDYPMRPGQTQLDIEYAVPLSDPLTFSGKILHSEGQTRLIVPKGLALEGEGLEAFEPEPRTQSPIYGVKSGAFTVKITGKAAPAPSEEEDTGQPEVSAQRPRIYTRVAWVIVFTVLILGLGLYLVAQGGGVRPSAKGKQK